jgi:uracil-DNA glycosylase family 4
MDKKEDLLKIKKEMLADESLPLRKGATQLVFGDGSPNAELFFLGEGPGYWEDQKGIPFVGNAGALLNRMLAAINIKREDVFITNVVCFRPPSNRDPEASEIAAFQPYIDRIIKVINPKVMITLGRFSMAKFMPGVTISRVHGKPRVVEFKGKDLVVVPMYHPAAALRNGEILRQFREDFLRLPEILANIDELKGEKKEEKEEAKQMELI